MICNYTIKYQAFLNHICSDIGGQQSHGRWIVFSNSSLDFAECPLTLTAQLEGCADLIKVLKNGGAHLDFRTKDGITALHKAVRSKNHTALIVRILLKQTPKLRLLLLHKHLYKLNQCLTDRDCNTVGHFHNLKQGSKISKSWGHDSWHKKHQWKKKQDYCRKVQLCSISFLKDGSFYFYKATLYKAGGQNAEVNYNYTVQ